MSTATIRVAPSDEQGGVVVCTLEGTIDESFPVDALVRVLRAGDPTALDLGGVTRITSFGVRAWVSALKERGETPVYFQNLRPSLVTQLNTVPDFGGGGTVVSLFCPYVCQECHEAFEVLLDLRRTPAGAPRQLPQPKCPKCQGPAELDEFEETYFSFLPETQPAPLPEQLAQALDQEPRRAATIRASKRVGPGLTLVLLSGLLDERAKLKRYFDGAEGKLACVLSGLLDATPKGVEGLLQALEQADRGKDDDGERIALVRVPLGLLEAVWANRDRLAKFELISVVTRNRCEYCAAINERDVTAWGDGVPLDATVCHACHKDALGIGWSPEAAQRIAALVPTQAKGALASWLELHQHDTFAELSAPRLSAPPGPRPQADRARYEIVKRLGADGLAESFLARSADPQASGQRVIIKRIQRQLSKQPGFVERLTAEMSHVLRLSHPHLVRSLELGHDGDQHFIVMEQLEGKALSSLLREASSPLPIEVARRIFADSARGLEAAHGLRGEDGEPTPVLHRDLSPHSIWVDPEGVARLTDFGLALGAEPFEPADEGLAKGRLAYTAPELLEGEPSSVASDVFALGVTLYVSLAGRLPFARETSAATMRAMLEGAATPLSSVRPEVPAGLAELVSRAIALRPEERPSSAKAFAEELERELSEESRGAVKRWYAEQR